MIQFLMPKQLVNGNGNGSDHTEFEGDLSRKPYTMSNRNK
jgi:hypothetical protein